MTSSPLYRSQVLEAKRNRWLGSLILRQPMSHWAMTWIAIGTVAIAVTFLYLGEYARKVRVEGRLIETAIETAIGPAGATLPAAATHAPLEAELWVPETLLASTVIGSEVLLRYPAFPHQHYGQYRGHIVSIARQPMSSAGAQRTDRVAGHPTSRYRITVALELQRVRSEQGIQRDLHPGLSVEADVVVERRRLYAWLFEPFSRMRDRLRG